MKQKLKRAGALLLTMLLLSLLISAQAAPAHEKKRTVRVGYVYVNGFFQKNDAGGYTGFGYELLQEIAMYTGWEYSYVEGTLADCLSMLERGELDLLMPLQKTAERAALYNYSAQPVCKNRGGLLALTSTPFCYRDYASFEKLRIGGIRGNYNNVLAMEQLRAHGCDPELVEYDTQEKLEAMWRMKLVDAIVFTSVRGLSGGRVIEDFDTVDSYLTATRHKPALIAEVDYAMAQITANSPNLISDLENRYSGMGGGMVPSFTKEEEAYIAARKQVRILTDSGEYGAPAAGIPGASAQMLEELEKKTGLKFEALVDESLSSRLKRFAAGEADLLFRMEHDYAWARAHNCWLTAPYLKTPTICVKRTGAEAPRILALERDSYLADLLRHRRDYDVVYCDCVEEGLQMVKNGTADATYCSQMTSNYFSAFPRYGVLSFTELTDFTDRYCMGVSKQSDIVLVSILNKALACIQPEKLEGMLAGHPSGRKLTVEDYYFTNPQASVLAVAGTVTTLVTILALLVFGTITRRKNLALQKATAAKTDFLSDMSHDMRTPMNAIIGMTTLAQESQGLTPELRDYLKSIALSGNYLLSLINDTLDMNKIEGNQLTLRPEAMCMAELCSSLSAVLQGQAKAGAVELSFVTDATAADYVLLDQMRIRQVFFNLLSNAIKFTPSGGHVSLSIRTLRVHDGIRFLECVVRDDGIGIGADFMPKLFAPFEQEAQATAAYGGTGLGLAITKNLVEKMDGSICVQSKKGEGTVFTLQLPCRIVSPPKERKTEEIGDLTGCCVLLAEDHPLNVEVARQLLKKRGISVETAGDGAAAVRLFAESAENHFDAILMDVRMPILDGLAATEQIRALPRADARTVAIFAMTADAFNIDEEKTRRVGMNGHLTKPVEPEKLYRALWTAFDSRRKKRNEGLDGTSE